MFIRNRDANALGGFISIHHLASYLSQFFFATSSLPQPLLLNHLVTYFFYCTVCSSLGFKTWVLISCAAAPARVVPRACEIVGGCVWSVALLRPWAVVPCTRLQLVTVFHGHTGPGDALGSHYPVGLTGPPRTRVQQHRGASRVNGGVRVATGVFVPAPSPAPFGAAPAVRATFQLNLGLASGWGFPGLNDIFLLSRLFPTFRIQGLGFRV
jgi:hypothetical protein